MDISLFERMEVFSLHSVPHLMEQCCLLLNMEWKRSEVARMRSLEASCDTLPTCLVLICVQNNITQVIGHSRLSRIPTMSYGCFVESVVIHPNFRRKGLGKFLMMKTEEYAKSRGFSTVFLSTHDQELFYGKLGYTECPPVSIYGSMIPLHTKKEGDVVTRSGMQLIPPSKSCDQSLSQTYDSLQGCVPLPPPPPPPPPPMAVHQGANVLKKIFMSKQLS